MVSGNQKLKYHCVEVVGRADACAAAKLLKSVRLLSAEAPVLPLKTCERPADCKCVYRHFDDRRQGPRREHEHGRTLIRSAHKGTERRKRPGRREIDFY